MTERGDTVSKMGSGSAGQPLTQLLAFVFVLVLAVTAAELPNSVRYGGGAGYEGAGAGGGGGGRGRTGERAKDGAGRTVGVGDEERGECGKRPGGRCGSLPARRAMSASEYGEGDGDSGC